MTPKRVTLSAESKIIDLTDHTPHVLQAPLVVVGAVEGGRFRFQWQARVFETNLANVKNVQSIIRGAQVLIKIRKPGAEDWDGYDRMSVAEGAKAAAKLRRQGFEVEIFVLCDRTLGCKRIALHPGACNI